MATDWFTAKFPRLYHIAEAGAERHIMRRGLLSTSGLLDVYGIQGQARYHIEASHRPKSVALPSEENPEAVIRDQHAMIESQLVLKGTTLRDWHRLLNSRVYFWPTRRRADRMRGAYENSVVFVVDTRQLLDRHPDGVTLCPFNSGSTARGATERGPHLFYRLDDYPIEERRKRTGGWSEAVAEVAVAHSVPDVTDILVEVLR